MFTFPRLPWLLTALLITAALHCASGHEISIDAEGLPHKHCHDEFGCLCKGATLTASVDIEQGDLAGQFLELPLDARPVAADAANAAAALASRSTPPPLAGRALRAQLASLVI